jgi:hypothetical protein
MDITQLRKARATKTTVDLWGNAVAIWYVPKSINPKMLRELRESQEAPAPPAEGESITEATVLESLEGAQGSVTALLTTFLSIVTDWDLERGGVKIPLTPEGLDELELDILSEILRQLRETQSPNDVSGMPTERPS